MDKLSAESRDPEHGPLVIATSKGDSQEMGMSIRGMCVGASPQSLEAGRRDSSLRQISRG